MAERKLVNRWSDFRRKFAEVFPSAVTDTERERDIYQRTQIPHETIDTYVSTIKIMNNLMTGPLQETKLLDIIMMGLHSNYRIKVINQTFSTLDELVKVCRLFELAEHKNSQYMPPPAKFLQTSGGVFAAWFAVGQQSANFRPNSEKRFSGPVTCFKYGKMGHIRSSCPENKNWTNNSFFPNQRFSGQSKTSYHAPTQQCPTCNHVCDKPSQYSNYNDGRSPAGHPESTSRTSGSSTKQ